MDGEDGGEAALLDLGLDLAGGENANRNMEGLSAAEDRLLCREGVVVVENQCVMTVSSDVCLRIFGPRPKFLVAVHLST